MAESKFEICVVGGGCWGTALANHLANLNLRTVLWLRDANIAQTIREKHYNPKHLAEFPLNANLIATSDPEVLRSPLLLLAIPCQSLRQWLEQYQDYVAQATIINAAKGLERGTLLTPSAIVQEVLGSKICYAMLSGPSFAAGLLQNLPTAIVLACKEVEIGRHLQKQFSGKALRCYFSSDVLGVEFGGALKNVIAIAAGICDALGLGDNGRAAVITRGLAEISRLGVSSGAKQETFMGLSGLGDLVLTCTGNLSRNRQVGLHLGRGENLEQIIANLGMVAEGVQTTAAMYALAQKLAQEAPIAQAVHNIIDNKQKPLEVLQNLLARDLKDEAK